MNYVLAPLFLLNLSSRDEIYSLYSCFLSRLLAFTFSDSDFGSLQCTFLLFQLTLLYHDPELAQFLTKYDMGPELFASSWFITLFSNRCKLSVLFYLWSDARAQIGKKKKQQQQQQQHSKQCEYTTTDFLF